MLSAPVGEANSEPATTPKPPAAEHVIATRLLEYLRATLKRPALAYEEAPARVMGGFETLIYSFNLGGAPSDFTGPLILRVLRRHEAERAAREAAIQNTVLDLRFAAPRVLCAVTSADELGAPFLIMKKVLGRTLAPELEGLGQGRSPRELLRLTLGAYRRSRETIALMTQTHAALHRLPGDALIRAFEREGLATDLITRDGRLNFMLERIASQRLAGLRQPVTWLFEHRPTEPTNRAICHGDFQPFNILVANGKVTAVLDWGNAAVGDPAMDVGATVASFVTVPLAHPAPFRRTGYMLMRMGRRAYLRAYTQVNHLSLEKLRYYEAMRCVRELVWLADRAEHGDLQLGVYRSAEGVRRLCLYLRRLTGLSVRFPFSF